MNTPLCLASERSGVYQPPPDVGTLRDSVIAGNGVWLELDLAHVRTKDDLLRAFARALRLPTFGHNWDALADVLQDVSWRAANSYVLHVPNAACAERALGEEWETLLEILSGSAMYWKNLGKPFIVFVDSAQALPQWT